MHAHDLSLHDVLARLSARRRFLRQLGATGLISVVGCVAVNGGDTAGDSSGGGTSGDDGADASSSGDASTGGIDSCSAIPQETAGPYPSDGTNGPDALALSGIVRADIRASIGDATGVIEDGFLVLRVDLRPADQRG